MVDTTDDILIDGKYNLAKEKRLAQADLARDIEYVFYQGSTGTILAEGGTGIGKSFAYLIPSIITGKRLVIATATRNLQHQLERDLPVILKKMNCPYKFTVYKGNRNYGCVFLAKNIKNEFERAKYTDWVNAHFNKQTPAGLSDWAGKKPVWWDSVSAENCVYERECTHYAYCRPKPGDYHIIIANHSILAIDLLLKNIPGFLLGPYDILVLDEAHKAPGYFRNALTSSLSPTTFARFCERFNNDTLAHELLEHCNMSVSATNIKTVLKIANNRVQELFDTFAQATDSKQAQRVVNIHEGFDAANKLLIDLRDTCLLLEQGIKGVSQDLFAIRKDESLGLPFSSPYPTMTSKGEIIAGMSNINRYHRQIGNFKVVAHRLIEMAHIETANDNNGKDVHETFLVTIDDKGIHTQPIDIGSILEPKLSQINYKIITSATLTIDDKFDHIRTQLGIQPEDNYLSEVVYKSAFDFDNQVRIYAPQEMPPPRYSTESRQKWVDAQAEKIEQLVSGTRGDALVLFTAEKDLQEIWNELDHEGLKSEGLTLIRQEGDAAYALKAFQEQRGSVLFGLKSFWEGVNLPGNQLRLVIITKLPFPPISDPLFDALRRRAKQDNKNSFIAVDIPEMITDMRQATGRLIRQMDDVGVIAILDPRVWSGDGRAHYTVLRNIQKAPPGKRRPQGYGWKLIKSLGYRKRAKDFTDAIAFANKQLKC